MTYHFGATESLLMAILVLFLGAFINSKIKVLRTYSIPEPIVGGLVVAFVIALLHAQGVNIKFTLPLQGDLMLMFFATVGLASSYKLLLQGGAKMLFFLGIATVLLFCQNVIGVSLMSLFGLEELLGLIVGSITLSGGHGTGAAWAATYANDFGISAMELSMAAATFGLVAGGLIGGPIAESLIKRHNLKATENLTDDEKSAQPTETYSDVQDTTIAVRNIIRVLFVLVVCVWGSGYLKTAVDALGIDFLRIPRFVLALFIGVVIRNFTELVPVMKINPHTVNVLGSISLSLFLAMALMSLRLWELVGLAVPMIVILLVQTAFMALFAYFITFRLMGKDYDAAVIAAGHAGFGMGATPTAVMNMGVVVGRHGSSPKAFMVVPVVGAFFIDITNLIVLQFFVGWLV